MYRVAHLCLISPQRSLPLKSGSGHLTGPNRGPIQVQLILPFKNLKNIQFCSKIFSSMVVLVSFRTIVLFYCDGLGTCPDVISPLLKVTNPRRKPVPKVNPVRVQHLEPV
ncbi:hypothetical protein ATANTOWER_016062 [Ataeniobius toweri]|uniref:Uncharacterized protein n=1 Tax=Ataeniobius toweri TaxID=208326 RepID=A0ABU7AFS1_9TELE|nr:hypothetical protein [Ataeniobius toweri]